MTKRMNVLCMVPGGRRGTKGWNLRATDFSWMKRELQATEQHLVSNEFNITEHTQQRGSALDGR